MHEYAIALLAVAISASGYPVEVSYEICLNRVFEASSCVDSALFDLRKKWRQPSLSHTIVVESNLNDVLEYDQQLKEKELQKYKPLKTYSPEYFGRQLASFYHQLFNGVPVDNLYIISIDTEPEKIKKTVDDMLSHIKTRFVERGHEIENSDVCLERIHFRNPSRCYWREKENVIDYPINPFVVSSCQIHNQEVQLDKNWKDITSKENLELAWARVRREMLRETFLDQIEIRLFENNLDYHLDRLHFELESYAVDIGLFPKSLQYFTPKNSDKDRPRGLTWFEEEILIVAIIQVIGTNVLLQKPWSYAYRLSPENSLERGATEYLYERWFDAWESFLQDVRDYIGKYPDCVVVKTDIKSYYTQILRDRLSELINEELKVSKRIEWLLSLLLEQDIEGHDPGKGLVQGSVGSGFLANVYLTPLDFLFPTNDQKKKKTFPIC